MIVVLMGASGSGKSTWARNAMTGHEHIYCLDDIRFGYEMDIQAYAHNKRMQAIKAVEQGKPLIADATHLIRAHRDVWRSLADRLNLETQLIAFDTPLNTLLQVQMHRTNPAPRSVVVNGFKQFQLAKQGIHKEGWDSVKVIHRSYPQGNDKEIL